MKGLWFSAGDDFLRFDDHRRVVLSQTLDIERKPEAGAFGLHGCNKLMTAIRLSPGDTNKLFLVELGGEISASTEYTGSYAGQTRAHTDVVDITKSGLADAWKKKAVEIVFAIMCENIEVEQAHIQEMNRYCGSDASGVLKLSLSEHYSIETAKHIDALCSAGARIDLVSYAISHAHAIYRGEYDTNAVLLSYEDEFFAIMKNITGWTL